MNSRVTVSVGWFDDRTPASSKTNTRMPTTISLYLPADCLPDVQTMLRQIRAVEPTFSFAKGFDPASDSGWVPCSVIDTECGFGWSYAPCGKEREELQGQHLGFVATGSYRSCPADGICAALVLGQVAVCSGGVIEKPDGDLLYPGEVGEWVNTQLVALKASKPKQRTRKRVQPDAEALITEALAALPGARVLKLVFSTKDDPGFTARFDCGVGISGRRWTLTVDGCPAVSTQAMPRDMPTGDQRTLSEASDLLTRALKAGPVHSAAFDAGSLELRISLTGATLRLHANADKYPTRYDQAFATGDRWEVFVKEGWLYPDIHSGRLEAQWVGR